MSSWATRYPQHIRGSPVLRPANSGQLCVVWRSFNSFPCLFPQTKDLPQQARKASNELVSKTLSRECTALSCSRPQRPIGWTCTSSASLRVTVTRAAMASSSRKSEEVTWFTTRGPPKTGHRSQDVRHGNCCGGCRREATTPTPKGIITDTKSGTIHGHFNMSHAVRATSRCHIDFFSLLLSSGQVLRAPFY